MSIAFRMICPRQSGAQDAKAGIFNLIRKTAENGMPWFIHILKGIYGIEACSLAGATGRLQWVLLEVFI
jgi:hypothetical protein